MIDQNQIKTIFGADAALSFYQHLRQSYAPHVPLPNGKKDEINIGVYHEEGGTSGEFLIVSEDLGSTKPALRLKMFDDSWKIIPYLSEFFDLLSKSEGISLEDLVLKLIEIGFTDRSHRKLGAEAETADRPDLSDEIAQIENHLKGIDPKSPAFAIYSKALDELKALL